jgi:preprotein translocase subunit SecA
MITKSIERAQKKVEENNFGIRKRLLEYDDVMNYQREAIYKRRRNALFGERLQLDILNTLYDTCEDIVNNTQGNTDGFKLTVIGTLGFEPAITDEEFNKLNVTQLTGKLYNQAEKHYYSKNKQIADKAFPVLNDVYQTRGATIEEVVVPFTDGIRQMNVVASLRKVVETQGKELVRAMEKSITLAIIDQEWKEHLRDMDDLKQSVQNAVFEQKDPLLIYKFESVELFKRFVAKVNGDTISFLLKADIPVQDSEEVREARRQRQVQQQKLQISKEEVHSSLEAGQRTSPEGAMPAAPPPVEKAAPMRSAKVANRNDLVSVQYRDGSIKKDVKFKKVEEDLRNNRCVLIED